jgi:Sulfotransferase domain.
MVGGHVRSGTSLLRELCNRHPEMTITHEFGTFLELGKPFPVYKRAIVNRWKRSPFLGFRVFRSDRKNTRVRRWFRSIRGHVFAYRYLKQLEGSANGSVQFETVEAILKQIFPTRIVGDKWPDYAVHLDRLTPLFEQHDARCLIIYRDCRDVTSSTLFHARTVWKNEEWIKGATAEKVAQRWVNTIEMMEKYRNKIHTICYENLVKTPEKEISKIADYLQVDPKGFPIQMIRKINIGKHATGLTEEELSDLIRIAGPTMTRLGYTVTSNIVV